MNASVQSARDFDLPGVFEVWEPVYESGSGLVSASGIPLFSCLCILVGVFLHFCWSNDNTMMRTSCFLWLEWNELKLFSPSVQVYSILSFFFSTQVSNRHSLSFDIKAAYMKGLIHMVLGDGHDKKYMKAACQHCMWSYCLGILKTEVLEHSVQPLLCWKSGMCWANYIWISFGCQTKPKHNHFVSLSW